MTQPPLTQAVQSLETEFEVRLFDRNKKSVALTPAGEALLVLARRLLRDADELPRTVKAAANGFTGHLRLGFVSTVTYGSLPHLLRSFRESNPDVSLRLSEATLDVQLAAFDSDNLDAGFVVHAPGAAPAGFATVSVSAEPLVLALPAGHPAADGKEMLHFDDFALDPLVIFPRQISPSLFDAILSFYRANDVTPVIAQEAIQMQTIVSLVSGGMGVAWVPAVIARLHRTGVVYKYVNGNPPSSETSLIWKEPTMPVVDRFVSHVKDAGDCPARDR